MELPLSRIWTQPLKNLYQHVDVSVLRLDEVHPQVSGNKWFKLSGYLNRVRGTGAGILTWGGAWSNHLLATAAACNELGIPSIALVRGEAPAQLSATLTDAAALGMQLRFLTRTEYAQKQLPPDLKAALDAGSWLEVPEGGAGPDGRDGAARIAATTGWKDYTHILAAVGTGTTVSGLLTASMPAQEVIGIAVLKGAPGLENDVHALAPPETHERLTMEHAFHCGGYARITPELIAFMNDWYRRTGIPSDIVYTGKLFLATDALIRSGRFAAGSRLLVIHSGGLQGNRSLPPGTLIF